MATIHPEFTRERDNLQEILWETLTEADTAAAINPEHFGSLGTIQVIGTFGSATVILQGSNDGTNWVALKDLGDNAISLTAAGGFQFQTAFKFLRPSASGGSSQDVDCLMTLRSDAGGSKVI